ncbi:MAG: choice-of-anchor M domain-containing protein [Corynebacterium sp.]|nr:choice-of-anchor M domain-containing protein [Corynebacterium sp.]
MKTKNQSKFQILAAALVAVLSLAVSPAVAVAESEASAAVEVRQGHVDLGPNLDLELEVLDSESWKPAGQLLFVLDDKAKQEVPADYSFIGSDTAWVIPQVQEAGIPWLGWNTQYPGLEQVIDRGIFLEYAGFEGPGDFTLFVNSGFGQPEVLMSSRQDTQPLWVDAGTHTHANWVFTKPGDYAVHLRLSATTHDGQSINKEGTLRFRVESDSTTESGSGWMLPVGIGILVVVIVALLGIAVGRRRK